LNARKTRAISPGVPEPLVLGGFSFIYSKVYQVSSGDSPKDSE
jgi:hypothetical protein